MAFNKWLFHYILCLVLYGFELQLGGTVEFSPRVLVVLKPALGPGIEIGSNMELMEIGRMAEYA